MEETKQTDLNDSFDLLSQAIRNEAHTQARESVNARFEGQDEKAALCHEKMLAMSTFTEIVDVLRQDANKLSALTTVDQVRQFRIRTPFTTQATKDALEEQLKEKRTKIPAQPIETPAAANPVTRRTGGTSGEQLEPYFFLALEGLPSNKGTMDQIVASMRNMMEEDNVLKAADNVVGSDGKTPFLVQNTARLRSDISKREEKYIESHGIGRWTEWSLTATGREHAKRLQGARRGGLLNGHKTEATANNQAATATA